MSNSVPQIEFFPWQLAFNSYEQLCNSRKENNAQSSGIFFKWDHIKKISFIVSRFFYLNCHGVNIINLKK